MEEIIARQQDRPERMTGKAFLLAVAGMMIRLAIAQILCNWMITATGVGLINTLFYLYAVWLLVRFMKRTVASYVYTLKTGTLILQRQLGDSTTTVIEIPFGELVSVRPVKAGERLHLCYRQVTVMDPAARPPVRIRVAFGASLLSARLARRIAGEGIHAEVGYVAVYRENGRMRACVFRPDEDMVKALKQALGDSFGWDERIARPKRTTLYARALQRAFPDLYPYVEPLIRADDVIWAKEELARQREAKAHAGLAREEKGKKEKKGAGGNGRTPDGKPDAQDAGNREEQGGPRTRRRRQR
ncbi:MAG TPA: hypothetical protein IAC49_08520 [Candidatus Ventricola intestinavium]|nr:hypothetical protein [Candidatus Ventricola intestinavium]